MNTSENPRQAVFVDTLAAGLQHILAHVGQHAVVGTPLGIGKPNSVLNALWRHAVAHPEFRLDLFTALSLAVPEGRQELERRFLAPFVRRHFAGYEALEYIEPLRKSQVPDNIRISEFYFQPGSMLRSSQAQRWYTSSNYTHVARDMLATGMNVLVQQVGIQRRNDRCRLSLGSNTDVTLDLIQRLQEQPDTPRPLLVAQVNPNMPFMTGQADVPPDFFDVVIDDPAHYYTQYAVPRQPVGDIDYAIGLWASTLIEDGGTLQIGIGSLGDALVSALELRHSAPDRWRAVLTALGAEHRIPAGLRKYRRMGRFEAGLYGASEMFTEGFQALRASGILKRHVYDDIMLQTLLNDGRITEQVTENTLRELLTAGAINPVLNKESVRWLCYWGIFRPQVRWRDGKLKLPDGTDIAADLSCADVWQVVVRQALGKRLRHGVLLHGAFFLGSHDFYRWLHDMEDAEREKYQMVPVSFVNELYGRERLDRLQRQKARFMNTTMKVSVLGQAASDGLSDNQEISGVGGQYNFVAMAHALRDSRSVLMLRSVRETHGGASSNVVWSYDYDTIPRHLRDIVVTEYGIADLRGKNDEQCIQAMLSLCDARFQPALVEKAKRHGKLDKNWSPPPHYALNTPDNLRRALNRYRADGLFQPFPHGSDFDLVEQQLIGALKWLKSNTATRSGRLRTLLRAMSAKAGKQDSQALERMGLSRPCGLREALLHRLVALALHSSGKTR